MPATQPNALRQDPRSTAELIHLTLAEPDEHRAWETLSALQFRGTREVLEAAQQLCASAESKERKLGVDILGQLGVEERTFPAERFDTLATMLSTERDPGVLESISVAFGHLRDPRAIDLLLPLQTHPDAAVRFGLVLGLGGHENERAIAALIDLSADADSDVRDWATFELGTILPTDTPEIRAALRARLTDLDNDTRAEALVGLARRKDMSVLDSLITELSSKEVDDRAVEAAEELADPRLLEPLLALQASCAEDGGDTDLFEAAIAACREAQTSGQRKAEA